MKTVDFFILLWMTLILLNLFWTSVNGYCRTSSAKTVAHNESCFYVLTYADNGNRDWTWREAEVHCQTNYNGHIAKFDSDLLEKARSISTGPFWLGPHIMSRSDECVAPDYCWDIPSEFWEPGHPHNNDGWQKCIRTYLGNGVNGSLASLACEAIQNYGVICEVDAIPKYATDSSPTLSLRCWFGTPQVVHGQPPPPTMGDDDFDPFLTGSLPQVSVADYLRSSHT
ncbi:unnamed protein product [Cyprideis torosa]|uniref:Uncharacterized protein n=1 Tax=Cyprideis torosa TaxID=163714 RepID=A0A7R8ZMQ1_9CRUS|nr:unnamed protein product [Cyprideis torosa]CAG0896146.1 unnamed protein product [Cyprideis torosa]